MIYFISDGEFVKIGFTEDDPSKRLSTMQTGNARNLVLLGTLEGTIDDESFLHSLLDNFRVNGEWFALTLDGLIRKAQISGCVGLDEKLEELQEMSSNYVAQIPLDIDLVATVSQWTAFAIAVLIHGASPTREGVAKALRTSSYSLPKLSQPKCNLMLKALIELGYKNAYGGLTTEGVRFLTQFIDGAIPPHPETEINSHIPGVTNQPNGR